MFVKLIKPKSNLLRHHLLLPFPPLPQRVMHQLVPLIGIVVWCHGTLTLIRTPLVSSLSLPHNRISPLASSSRLPTLPSPPLALALVSPPTEVESPKGMRWSLISITSLAHSMLMREICLWCGPRGAGRSQNRLRCSRRQVCCSSTGSSTPSRATSASSSHVTEQINSSFVSMTWLMRPRDPTRSTSFSSSLLSLSVSLLIPAICLSSVPFPPPSSLPILE
jgi:hypothetical protein